VFIHNTDQVVKVIRRWPEDVEGCYSSTAGK
jgi:hypothetical protein